MRASNKRSNRETREEETAVSTERIIALAWKLSSPHHCHGLESISSLNHFFWKGVDRVRDSRVWGKRDETVNCAVMDHGGFYSWKDWDRVHNPRLWKCDATSANSEGGHFCLRHMWFSTCILKLLILFSKALTQTWNSERGCLSLVGIKPRAMCMLDMGSMFCATELESQPLQVFKFQAIVTPVVGRLFYFCQPVPK